MDVTQAGVKMCCVPTKFPAFPFFGTHAKPHRVTGLSKHYHMLLDPKLGHGTCSILQIPCDYVACTTILEKS